MMTHSEPKTTQAIGRISFGRRDGIHLRRKYACQGNLP